MEKQQEVPNSSAIENGIDESEVIITAGEAVMPSIEDLDILLKESESIATIAAMSEEEIDNIVKQRQESLERLQNIDLIRESRLRRVENYNPLKDLRSSDYDRLVQEEIIDESYAERLKKLDAVIEKLESIDYPTADVLSTLEKAARERSIIRAKLESQIEEQQQEIATQREELKNKVLEHYMRRSRELEQIITEIESNPRVVERLQTIAEDEMKREFARREKAKREAEERIEKERQAIIRTATRYIQSLEARHGNTFKRLGELVDNEKIIDELLQTLSEEDLRKQQSVFDRVRSHLLNAIIEGEGDNQLKDPKEIVPWQVGPTTIQYKDAVDFLSFPETEEALRAAADAGSEQARKLLERRERIIKENEIIRRLVGRYWIIDKKTNEKRMGVFWAAFETRKKNDEAGITAARIKEREEAAKREATFRESAEEIIKRGGFIVEVPIVKEIRGRKEVVGKERGVVRLEKIKSKKGNEAWRVAEVFGETNGLKVGSVSPLDLRAFPEWLRESAKQHFIMRGPYFIERLTY